MLHYEGIIALGKTFPGIKGCSSEFAIPKQYYRISNPTKLVSGFPNIRTINPKKQKSLKYLWDTQISNFKFQILNTEH